MFDATEVRWKEGRVKRKIEKQGDRTAVYMGRGHALWLRLDMKMIG